MRSVKRYKVKGQINGSVIITPCPLGVRLNDADDTKLEVEVVYNTPDGRQRPFVLTDKKLVFETVTPGGARVSVSSESSDFFELIIPARGRFNFTLPPECRDGTGNCAIAYFRFIENESNIFSTGNFIYTVINDSYSVSAGNVKTPNNFISDLEKLKSEVDWLKKYLGVTIDDKRLQP